MGVARIDGIPGADGVALDEYAQMDPRAWGEAIRPALADRRGRALFIGTPQGRNGFRRLYVQADREVRLIDDCEASGVGLDHYVRMLKQRPYRYGQHVVPHDAEVHELSNGRSRVQTLRGLGLEVRVLPNPRSSRGRGLPLEDGINAARLLPPRCRFDEAACARGIEALRHYRCDWDPRRQAVRQRPRHDWASHATDAFRYLALGLREPDQDKMPPLRYDTRWAV